MRGPVVGRDAVLDLAVDALRDTGRVLVEGPAGIGKTVVLQALVDRAAGDGAVVVRCAPTEAEAALPLAALADLLAPLTDGIDALPEPQRRAVRAALLLDEGEPGPVDERALASAVRGVLDGAAEAAPGGLLVVVDDAPWLDPPSERALRFALRRTGERVHVLVGRRTDDAAAGDAPLGLDTGTPATRVTLPPLSVGPLHRVLADRFGVSLGRPMIARLARESQGNPLLAIELTRAVLRLPRLPGPGGDLPVPASVHALVTASLATLSEVHLQGVRVAALLSAPRRLDLEAAGVRPDALEAAEQLGLLATDGTGDVRFVHPTYASAIRAGIPPTVRRRLHATLADAVEDRDERARHLARCTTGPDDAAADELLAAADRTRARGAPELAADLYDAAASLTTDPRTAAERRLRALYCLYDGGDYRVAAQGVDALVPTVDGDLLAEALLLRAAVAFGCDELPLAAATARRALDAAPPASALAGRIHAHLAVYIDLAGPAREHAEAALALLDTGAPAAADRDPRGHGVLGRTDRALLASVLMLAFLNEVRTGLAPRVNVLDRALLLEDGEPSWLAGTVPAIWWKGVDQHARARDRLRAMLDAAVAAGDEPLQHELMQHLAETEILTGRLDVAAGWIAGARELSEQLGAGTAAERWLGGMLDALRGQHEAARLAGEQGLAEATTSDDPWLRRISLQLLGSAALAAGDAPAATDAYRQLAAAMDATGLVEPLAARFEGDWVEACVGAGDLDGAHEALDRLTRRHARLPRPWTALALARSRVLLAGATGADTAAAVDELLAARDAVPTDVIPLDRARCLLVAGLAHRRARRKRAAREALLAAADEFDGLGARGLAARARAEADRTGPRLAGPVELSTSEQRVADLAAAGATNREIADSLFISPKTVEATLARAYRKLAIARRAELATALRERTAAAGQDVAQGRT